MLQWLRNIFFRIYFFYMILLHAYKYLFPLTDFSSSIFNFYICFWFCNKTTIKNLNCGTFPHHNTFFIALSFLLCVVCVYGGVFVVYTLLLYIIKSIVCHKRQWTIRRKYDIWIKINHLNVSIPWVLWKVKSWKFHVNW